MKIDRGRKERQIKTEREGKRREGETDGEER